MLTTLHNLLYSMLKVDNRMVICVCFHILVTLKNHKSHHHKIGIISVTPAHLIIGEKDPVLLPRPMVSCWDNTIRQSHRFQIRKYQKEFSGPLARPFIYCMSGSSNRWQMSSVSSPDMHMGSSRCHTVLQSDKMKILLTWDKIEMNLNSWNLSSFI
jgi:hypothetical protein